MTEEGADPEKMERRDWATKYVFRTFVDEIRHLDGADQARFPTKNSRERKRQVAT